MTNLTTRSLAFALALAGCNGAPADPAGDNPFLAEQVDDDGKADTAYLNPDGIEVEVDLEADVEGPTYRLADGPAELGQFALTYLRNRGHLYLESLAEDATSDTRPEWLVDGKWVSTADLGRVPGATLKHFRLRGVNAVLLHEAARGVTAGRVFTARVPRAPFTLHGDAGDSCADFNSHISLSQSVYWYLWNPDHAGCKAATQEMKVTVAKLVPKGKTVYPEFDRLLADKKITAVILFGQIGDDLSDSDPGFQNLRRMASWLGQAGFKKGTAPVGERWSKVVAGKTLEIDLYSPREFSGLSDHGHFDNFQKALSEHEIVAYDGHSMLGASDFWSRPKYPDSYQIFLYGGCLGYEYYVRPILTGKGGWKNVDLVSSVVEVSVDANEYAGPFLAKMVYALEHSNRVSWRSLLLAIRNRVGDSTFGASGVRDNCYSPYGSNCR